ncbi:hypothetical protein AABK37_21970, partial [Hassallia sp. VBCCA 56010]
MKQCLRQRIYSQKLSVENLVGCKIISNRRKFYWIVAVSIITTFVQTCLPLKAQMNIEGETRETRETGGQGDSLETRGTRETLGAGFPRPMPDAHCPMPDAHCPLPDAHCP